VLGVAERVTCAANSGSWGAFSDDLQVMAGAATTGAPGALIRGGGSNSGVAGGVFAVRASVSPSDSASFPDVGFRAAR
jgi:hypothetical protein